MARTSARRPAGRWHWAPRVGIMGRSGNNPCATTRWAAVMSTSVVEFEVPIEESEAYRALPGRASKKTGKIPAEILVRHVLGVVPAEEWPVRVEAMDALLRRVEAVRQDKLRIEARPADGHLLGLYATRRPGSGSRPYRTILQGVDPVR